MIVGTRHHQASRRGLPAFVSMSVIALLALACFPVLAHATDSSGVQYSDDLPTLPPEKPDKQEPKAGKSDADNGGVSPKERSGSPESEGSEEGDSSEQGGGVSVGGDNGDKGQRSPGSSANGADKAPVQSGGQGKGTPVSEQSDGGSSPLVPILVAILILAAISFAVVTIRQRRQRGPTTPASEAS